MSVAPLALETPVDHPTHYGAIYAKLLRNFAMGFPQTGQGFANPFRTFVVWHMIIPVGA